jgi:hypothetical protein
MTAGGIQRIYDGGWDPSVESGRHKSANVQIRTNYELLHLEPSHWTNYYRRLLQPTAPAHY